MITPRDIKAAKDHFGFNAPEPVEKDWHMLRAMTAIVAVDASPFRLVFAGGTCLARAHRLIERMSEDVDFKVVPQESALALSNAQRRKHLGDLRERIVASLRNAGFIVDPAHYRSRNDNRYTVFNLPYPSSSGEGAVLRPTLQIELTYATLRCESVAQPLTSFVAEAYRQSPEIASIECVSVTETAAEKIVALTRRTAMELAGVSRSPDRSLVRHIFDLHQIRGHVDDAMAARIARTIAMADGQEFKNQYPEYAANPSAEIARALEALRTQPEKRERYNEFVAAMVYGNHPDFDSAIAVVEDLATRLGLVDAGEHQPDDPGSALRF